MSHEQRKYESQTTTSIQGTGSNYKSIVVMYTVDSEYKNLILDSGIRYHRHTGIPTYHLSFYTYTNPSILS